MFIWPCSHTLATCSRGKRPAPIGCWVFRVNTLRHRILMLCIECFNSHAGPVMPRWVRYHIAPKYRGLSSGSDARPINQSKFSYCGENSPSQLSKERKHLAFSASQIFWVLRADNCRLVLYKWMFPALTVNLCVDQVVVWYRWELPWLFCPSLVRLSFDIGARLIGVSEPLDIVRGWSSERRAYICSRQRSSRCFLSVPGRIWYHF